MPIRRPSLGSTGTVPPLSVSWMRSWRTRGRLPAPEAASGDRRPAFRPAELRLELGRERQQRGVLAVAADDHHADRQLVLAGAGRDGDRGVAREVPLEA